MKCLAKNAEGMPGQRGWRVRDIAIILFVAGVLLVPSLFTRDLWNPDEPRYMEVAREMVVLDNYLIPHLNGEIYPDKPPMFFWLAAGLYKCGLGYNSGRILAILAAMGTLLLTYSIARRLMPHPGPLIAALTTLTGGLFLFTARVGVIDPLLCFFVTLSIVEGLRALAPEASRSRAHWIVAYVAAGLAVLTKGPVGILIPFVVLLCYGLANRGNLRKGGWIHLAGVAALVATVAAWLVPALVAGGEAYRGEILFKQNVGRVVNSYSHRNPFYYYLMLSPGLFLPWSLLFGLGLFSAFRAWWHERELAATTGLMWLLPIIVVFSFISGKRVGYVLPMMPAFGLIMARYLVIGVQRPLPWPRLHRAFVSVTVWAVAAALLITLVGLAVAGKVAPMLHTNMPDSGGQPFHIPTCSLLQTVFLGMGALAVAVAVFAGWRAVVKQNKNGLLLPLAIGLIVFSSVLGDVALIPYANHFKSGKVFVAEAKESVEASEYLFLYPKDFSGVYNLYTTRVSMPVLPMPEDLRNALSQEGRVAVIGRDKDFEKVFEDIPPELHVAASMGVGHRNMWLLTNWVPAGAYASGRAVLYPRKQINERISNP